MSQNLLDRTPLIATITLSLIVTCAWIALLCYGLVRLSGLLF
jgi:hypothetical protein